MPLTGLWQPGWAWRMCCVTGTGNTPPQSSQFESCRMLPRRTLRLRSLASRCCSWCCWYWWCCCWCCWCCCWLSRASRTAADLLADVDGDEVLPACSSLTATSTGSVRITSRQCSPSFSHSSTSSRSVGNRGSTVFDWTALVEEDEGLPSATLAAAAGAPGAVAIAAAAGVVQVSSSATGRTDECWARR